MTSNESARVERALDQVRAGVRQRQAELATLDKELAKLPASLARVHEIQYVVEPQSVSHRPGIGRVIVFFKKAFYQAFMKWFMTSVIEQQNAFNSATARALRDLFERQAKLAQSTRDLEAKLADLDAKNGH